MGRQFQVAGEVMVTVKSSNSSLIGSTTQLGLSTDAVSISITLKHKDIPVDAFGESVPETQWMGGEAHISMNLIHVDTSVLDECLRLSMGGPNSVGQLGRAGTLMFGSGNTISLNLTSPVEGKPWLFPCCYLAETPVEIPVGTEKSIYHCNWRAFPGVSDPWGNGTGSLNVPLWSYATQ